MVNIISIFTALVYRRQTAYGYTVSYIVLKEACSVVGFNHLFFVLDLHVNSDKCSNAIIYCLL